MRTLRRIRRTGPWMAIAASLALLVALASLPGGQTPQPEQAAASVPTVLFTPECETASTKHRPIVVAGPWTGAEAAAFKTVLLHFSKTTGLPVVYASKTREIAEKLPKILRTRLSRGCPPDVALLPQPGLLRDLATEGHLKQIKPSTKRLVNRNLGRFWREQGSVDGVLYGVWFKAANKSTFWYSRRQFDAAGVTPPATWTDLLQTAARLRAHGTVPFSVAGKDGWTLTDWFENVYLQTAGPTRYEALAGHRLPWTDASVVAALRRLAEILRRPQWLDRRGTAAVLKTDFERSVRDVFSPGARTAMVYEGDFVASQIAPAQAHDAGTFAFPAITGAGQSVVVGGDVAALFIDSDAGQQLLRFLAGVKAAQLWARADGMSPNRRLSSDAYANPMTRALRHSLITAKTHSFDLSDTQAPAFGSSPGQGMAAILQDYLKGADIKTVTRRLEEAATRTDGQRADNT